MVKRPDVIKRNKERRKEKIKVKCPCGKDFFVVKSRIGYGAKYCSQKCYHKNTDHNHTGGKHWKLSKETRKRQGIHQIGEKNHNWKGGITNPRRNKKAKQWMRKIKKRDKFCLICGDDKKLEAHHLESFDLNLEKRYILDNGIVLCNKHHEEFHKKYGYGKNTKEQFDEFSQESIKSIKKIILCKSEIYNISLEEDCQFYANGILTHNTPPHIIRPKNKKALRFEVGRKARLEGNGKGKNIVFAKEVKHPGTRPNPFIRNTIQNKIKGIILDELAK